MFRVLRVNDFKKQFLIAYRVHQSIRTQQQVLALLPFVDELVIPYAFLRSQSTGNQVSTRMTLGLFPSKISLFHHGTHKGVILGDLPYDGFRQQIRTAVSHIADKHILSPDNCGDQCGPHTSDR